MFFPLTGPTAAFLLSYFWDTSLTWSLTATHSSASTSTFVALAKYRAHNGVELFVSSHSLPHFSPVQVHSFRLQHIRKSLNPPRCPFHRSARRGSWPSMLASLQINFELFKACCPGMMLQYRPWKALKTRSMKWNELALALRMTSWNPRQLSVSKPKVSLAFVTID